MMKNSCGRQKLAAVNRRNAKKRWGSALNESLISTLKELSIQFGFSIAMGDLILLGHGWYVTHTGLIRIARYNRCAGIHVRPVPEFSDPRGQRWAFEATAYKSRTCRGFVGYGDADPSNVTDLVRGAEMRVAETRAVNRALRKAYGIGICSVEELGTFSATPNSSPPHPNGAQVSNVSTNGQLRLRDQLCLLIRKYNLDATLVKAYAADFCG